MTPAVTLERMKQSCCVTAECDLLLFGLFSLPTLMKRQADITLIALAGAFLHSAAARQDGATEEFHSSRTAAAGGVQVQSTAPPHGIAALTSCHWLSDAAEVSAIFTAATCVIGSGSAGSVRCGRLYCCGVIHRANPTALYTAYVLCAQCVWTSEAPPAPTHSTVDLSPISKLALEFTKREASTCFSQLENK